MKPINLLPYRPSIALTDNPFSFVHAISLLSSNPYQSPAHSSVSNHSLFRLTPIRLAITLVGMGVVPAWGAQTPAMSATVSSSANTSANNTVNTLANSSATNSTLTTSSAAQTTANDSKGTTATQNAIPAATAQDSITTDANTAQPYLYQLNQQRVEDKIGQQLDNQTLADFNNFNQPVATLKQNQPSVGYSKALDQTTPQSVANQINNSKPAPRATVNTQAQAQITEQLTAEKQNFDAINQKVSEQTNLSNQNIANQNLSSQGVANDAGNIKSTDTINPNDYLPAYQQQTTALTTPQANSTVTAEPQGIVARLKNKLIGRGEGLNYIDISFANADAKLEPARNIKAALEKVTVESVSDFNASVNKLRQIAKDAAEAVGFYDTKIAFKHLGKDNIQVSLEVGKPVIVQNRIIDIRGEGGEGDNALPVYPVIEKEISPKEGDVFSHGIYKAAKATIEGVAQTNGYFDAKWLNSSVDIILPDNTADVDLIYDTKTRYHFDDVKIYSIDKQGNLTDDPDKLPLKPKLIKALMTYQKGDAYYQPFVTEFTNNLTATRYFNGVDVDVVMPSDEAASDIAFEQSGSATLSNANSSNTTADNTADTSDTSAAILPTNSTDQSLASQRLSSQSLASQSNSSELQSAGTVDSTTQKTVNQVQDPNDIAPIQFEVDDSTEQRLNAISRKAKNLLAAPEDMELSPEAENKSKNPLVVIANAVSKTAKKLDKDKDLPIKPREGQVIPKLTPQQVYETKQIPTYVVLNATKPHEAQVGLGYETDVGVRLTGKYQNNLVNRSGLQTGASVALSKVDQAVEFNASLPYKHPLNDKLTGTVGYQHKEVDDLVNTFEADTVYASIARNIYHDSGWNRTYSLRYRGDKLTVDPEKYSTDSLPYPFNNYASDYTQQALLAGYAINKTVADNMLTPTWGYSQRYSLEVGAKGALSDTNMAILRAGGTGMYTFGKDNKQQVIGRLDLGYLYSGDFYDVPYRSRFFAGGDSSIRGYNTDSLGPTYGGENFLVGGDALAVGSAEYNYEFRPSFRGAVFTDFGNAYDTTGEYDNATAVSIGTGIRWQSPIGLVRLDVAKGLTGDNNDVRLHFFIGSPL
ncbi:hypothetical protein E6P75_02525 [Moraxella osloensis]|uniref:Bacterial surface antigen (D15) domain-containing protein n=1 Tax=Faucicola osloensis TaxID=34062 RepID=A0AAW6T8W0_FAUOS|nr:BamA/TamA family outer membrane protein [Moraxella osloensis]MDI4509087.1 hypothetical protein [Moraxella osloensis]